MTSPSLGGVLKEAGVAVPEGVIVKVVENTDTHHHLVLPPKPTGELSDAELDVMAASACQLQMVAIGTQVC